MAKIVEETIVIKVSKLVKDQHAGIPITPEDFTESIETIVQELVGDSAVVEIFKAE
jgi:hypothetical protein